MQEYPCISFLLIAGSKSSGVPWLSTEHVLVVCDDDLALCFKVCCFQASMEKPEKESDHRHHEQTKSTQMTFLNQVKPLSNVIEDMGNPFIDESDDLLVLDTRDLADPSVVNTMRNLKKTGQEQ